jgi:predicted phosphate transport protein (TIGR00153 family)
MLGRFLPKTTSFFDYFEQHGALTIKACEEFLALAKNPAEIVARAKRIKELEHEADIITHKCIDDLHRTFITPIDRSDIHTLIKTLDDIVDSVDATASRMLLYEIDSLLPDTLELSELLVEATKAIMDAINSLRHIDHNAALINERCIVICGVENKADALLRSALARLFKEEKDAVKVIKWKEIYERLERATDHCEAVANIIQGIAIEAS